MKKILFFAIALVATLSVQSAMAWSSPGHFTIGYIAEQHLTPEAKAKCHHYLRHTLAYESCHMDHWRYSKGYEGTAHWHIGYAYPNRQYTGDFRDQIVKPENVLKSAAYRINEFHKGLKASYKEMPDTVVAFQIRALIHMMGDMHCPAHVAFPVEDKPTYEETSVYNRYRLKKNGKKFSYHSLWDSITDILYPKWKITEWAAMADRYTAKERAKICRGDANDWLDGIAKEVLRSYKIIPRDTDVANMSDKQLEQITELTYQQFAYAGYRLAHILNDVFKE